MDDLVSGLLPILISQKGHNQKARCNACARASASCRLCRHAALLALTRFFDWSSPPLSEPARLPEFVAAAPAADDATAGGGLSAPNDSGVRGTVQRAASTEQEMSFDSTECYSVI